MSVCLKGQVDANRQEWINDTTDSMFVFCKPMGIHQCFGSEACFLCQKGPGNSIKLRTARKEFATCFWSLNTLQSILPELVIKYCPFKTETAFAEPTFGYIYFLIKNWQSGVSQYVLECRFALLFTSLHLENRRHIWFTYFTFHFWMLLNSYLWSNSDGWFTHLCWNIFGDVLATHMWHLQIPACANGIATGWNNTNFRINDILILLVMLLKRCNGRL